MDGHEGESRANSARPDPAAPFFRGLVESASDAVLTVDDDGTVVYANDGVERLLGYDPMDLRGRPATAFVPDRFQDRSEDWYSRDACGDRSPSDGDAFEVTWRTADGEERRLSASTFEHRWDGDRFVTGLLRASPERDRVGELLREEETLLREVFDTSPVAFAVRNADGELVRANERAAELVGVGTDALPYDAGDDAEEWTILDPDGDPLSEAELPVAHTLETGEPVYNEEVVVERPDGERLHLSVSAAPILEDGEVTRVVSAAEDVTDLKRTQFELERRRAELETELSEVFSRVTDAFFALSEDLEFTYLNDEAATLLDRDPEELLGTNVWNEFSKAAETAFQREYERAFEAQEATSFVEYYPPLSSWFEVRAYPSETGLSVYFRDVTERVERERKLEQYETVVETMDDGVYVVDDEGTFVMVNDAYCELTGYSREELVGSHVSRVVDEGTVERAADIEAEMRDGTRHGGRFVADVHRADGTAVPAEAAFALMEAEDATYRVGVVRDVTERRRRQRELERYETIVETVDDGIYVLDRNMELSMVNQALADMTGYDRTELEGASVWEFLAGDTGALRGTIETMDEQMLAGERASATVELEAETADGDTFPAEATWVVRPDDDFERVGVVRDVTERKARERELRNRIDQQRAIAEFSRRALEDRPVEDLFEDAVDLVAETLDHEYAKVLELRPDEDDLLLAAGHGWSDDVLGSATVETGQGSQAGYTLVSREPVVVEDFPNEDRFSFPDLLADRGVTSGISTIVGSPDDPWGILETHATDRRSYGDHDVQFVQSVAHLLSTTIRRREREHRLERYETIVETVEDGVYALDPDERFAMVNDAFCEMTGYGREELLGEHASIVHSRAINDQVAEMAEGVADELGSATLDVELRTRDGGTIPVETRFGPYRYDDDNLARTGVVRDVTERKRFEQTLTALHESSRELLELETRDAVAESVLRTTTDVLGIPGAGIYLYDEEAAELRPAATSEYVEEIFGDVPAFSHGDDAITWRAYVEGETISFDDVRRTDLASRDDTPLRSGIWIPLGDHGVLGIVSEEVGSFSPEETELADLLAATAEAALDRVERERERREYQRELEERNERLDAFASMLAHELRNPLEIAQIYFRMAVEGDDGATEEVEDSLDRIEKMIDTLLAVTRGGEAAEATEPVALDEAAPQWWDAVDAEGTLEVEADDEVLADPARLGQLFENLFRNAAEHGAPTGSPEGEDGPGVTVRVGDLADGFYVEDDGPGIPPEEREAVFEPGYSTSNVGVGLGLAVVRQLVETHGWDCAITESESGGARFEITGVERPDE